MKSLSKSIVSLSYYIFVQERVYYFVVYERFQTVCHTDLQKTYFIFYAQVLR